MAADSGELDRHGGRFAPADTQARHAALLAGLAQGSDQGYDDARARRTDRMPERTGTTVYIDFLRRQPELMHRRHRYDGEGFVDFIKIDIAWFPANFGIELLQRAYRRGGEPSGFLRVGRVVEDKRQRSDPQSLGRGAAHQDQGSSAVGNRAGIRRRDGTVRPECGFERWNLLRVCLARLFVAVDHHFAFAADNGHRRDLPAEGTVFAGSASAR